MQLARQPGEHAPREARVALQLLQHGALGDVQQQAVCERLREDDVGLVEEHQRLAEARAGAHDLDHLLDALRRGEAELDLAVDDDVKADAGIPGAEHDVALGEVLRLGARGDAIELRPAHLAEHRQVGEERLYLDRGLAPALRQAVAGIVHGG